MEQLLKSNLSESISLQKRRCLKLKIGTKVKRLPSIPSKFEELCTYIEDKVPPFSEGEPYNMAYFDEEQEAISIQDDSDYESFMMFVEDEQIKIPKIFLMEESEEMLSFEEAYSACNRTMCVSWVKDSEMVRPPNLS